MDFKIPFAEVLKRLRTEKGLSQEKLAFASDLDKTFISLLERGERKPSINTLFSIAKGLGMKPSELMKQVEEGV